MDMLAKLTGRRLIVGALFLIGFLLATGRAEAVPAFARKYGMVCTGCHEAWPVLNNVGREMADYKTGQYVRIEGAVVNKESREVSPAYSVRDILPASPRQ